MKVLHGEVWYVSYVMKVLHGEVWCVLVCGEGVTWRGVVCVSMC